MFKTESYFAIYDLVYETVRAQHPQTFKELRNFLDHIEAEFSNIIEDVFEEFELE